MIFYDIMVEYELEKSVQSESEDINEQERRIGTRMNKNLKVLSLDENFITAYVYAIEKEKFDLAVSAKAEIQITDVWKLIKERLSDSMNMSCKLKKALYYKEIIVNDVKYLLAHTVPEKEELQDIKSCDLEAFLLGEPEYEKQYFEDVIIITGHTPTHYIDKNFKGKIWRGNNHIAVDCGAVYGNSLGCICLETGEEYYSQ